MYLSFVFRRQQNASNMPKAEKGWVVVCREGGYEAQYLTFVKRRWRELRQSENDQYNAREIEPHIGLDDRVVGDVV